VGMDTESGASFSPARPPRRIWWTGGGPGAGVGGVGFGVGEGVPWGLGLTGRQAGGGVGKDGGGDPVPPPPPHWGGPHGSPPRQHSHCWCHYLLPEIQPSAPLVLVGGELLPVRGGTIGCQDFASGCRQRPGVLPIRHRAHSRTAPKAANRPGCSSIPAAPSWVVPTKTPVTTPGSSPWAPRRSRTGCRIPMGNARWIVMASRGSSTTRPPSG